MKNILLALLTITVFTSCSSHDEITDTTTVLGTWKLTSHSDFTNLPDCMKQTKITFIEHGNLSGEIYEPNGGNCDKNNLVASYEKETETSYTIIGSSTILAEVELESNKLIWTDKSSTKIRVLNFVRN
ncbi:lipocalin family protein [Tenacibaculum discolor]|uniref:lipocalin family protein n=1 Tax=Tenacibaculum discolor TaxID=361581 RepID=UPI00142DE873|nr:lipocalin family protein [Tenacibaculum discolor]